MHRTEFADAEYYHVYNRGVEKRDIFLGARDYERFLFTLFACNDRHSHLNARHQYRDLNSVYEVERLARKRGRRELLVGVVCFCLMPNHVHLLLQQHGKNGIPLFMQKVGTAYTMYFNKKYDRSGALFQGTYRAIHVPSDRYFLPLTRYIHLNPLDLRVPYWRERGVPRAPWVQRFLADYRWSSYADYTGGNRYQFLLQQDLLRGIFKTSQDYAHYVRVGGRGTLRAISDHAQWDREEKKPRLNLGKPR